MPVSVDSAAVHGVISACTTSTIRLLRLTMLRYMHVVVVMGNNFMTVTPLLAQAVLFHDLD